MRRIQSSNVDHHHYGGTEVEDGVRVVVGVSDGIKVYVGGRVNVGVDVGAIVGVGVGVGVGLLIVK
jgi:hypothetical protein